METVGLCANLGRILWVTIHECYPARVCRKVPGTWNVNGGAQSGGLGGCAGRHE